MTPARRLLDDCFLHDRDRLGSNVDGLREIGVGEIGQRGEQHGPAALPLFEQLGATDGPLDEFLVAVAPRLLAVGGEKVRKT